LAINIRKLIFIKKRRDKTEVLNKFNVQKKNLPMMYRNERQTLNMAIGEMYVQQELPMDLAPVTKFSETW